jgi:hypothetical protein
MFLSEWISPLKRFELTPSYSKGFATFFPGLTRKFQASTHELSNMKSRLVLMPKWSDRSFIRSILEKRQQSRQKYKNCTKSIYLPCIIDEMGVESGSDQQETRNDSCLYRLL